VLVLVLNFADKYGVLSTEYWVVSTENRSCLSWFLPPPEHHRGRVRGRV